MASFDMGSSSMLESQRNIDFDSSQSESIVYREPNLSVRSLKQGVDSNSSKSSLSSLYSVGKLSRTKKGPSKMEDTAQFKAGMFTNLILELPDEERESVASMTEAKNFRNIFKNERKKSTEEPLMRPSQPKKSV